MTAIQAKGDVASALRIAASATAYGKNQHYSQRYEPSRRRYPANVAVDDDQQGDAEEEGDEGDADAEYEEQEEEVLYAGQPGNFRGKGWSRGRSRYRSRFGRRVFGQRQAYAYPPGSAQLAAHTRPNAQGPRPQSSATSTSTRPRYDQKQGARVNPDTWCNTCNEFGHISAFLPRRLCVKVQNQRMQCRQHLEDGPCDPSIPTRTAKQPPQGANRRQGLPSDRRSRWVGNGTTRSSSAQPKMESTMMIHR